MHFFIETDRFCRFLQSQVAAGRSFSPDVLAALAIESAVIAEALRESELEGISAEAMDEKRRPADSNRTAQ